MRWLIRPMLVSTAVALSLVYAPASAQTRPAPPPEGFRDAYADVGDGVRLHYVIGGDGPPLVLIHGWPETWFAWRDVMPALARTRKVVAVDMRGFGDSTITNGGYDRKTMAGDINRLAHRLFGSTPIDLAGHDWGGSTAAVYAYTFPGEVRRLAVLEALPQGPWTAQSPAPELWFYGLHRIPQLAEELTRDRERVYLEYFYRSFAMRPDTINAAAIDEYLRGYGRPGGMHPGFELVRNLPIDIENNRQAETNPIRIPVLAVGAERSMGERVASNLRHMATNVRGVVIPNTHHFILEDDPQEVIRILTEFFK
jgi:pimeloyl-ACP methyl ester carboxylesterase